MNEVNNLELIYLLSSSLGLKSLSERRMQKPGRRISGADSSAPEARPKAKAPDTVRVPALLNK